MKQLNLKLTVIILGFAFLTTACVTRPGFMDSPPAGYTPSDARSAFTIHVTGKGIAPESAISKGHAILLAERAAYADAYRKLAESIQGLYIQAYMKMGNEVIDYDFIRIETASWLRGMEVVNIKQGDYGITEVEMQVRMNVSPDHVLYAMRDSSEFSSASMTSPNSVK